MTQPDGNIRPSVLRLEDEVRQLRQELQALQSRSLRAAGEFYTQAPTGTKTFQTGPFVSVPMPDGTPQWLTIMRDVNGTARWAVYDPDTVSGGFVQTLWEWDHAGNILRTSDILGGWAEPWLPVNLYTRFSMGASSVFSYMNLPVDVAERTLWSGSIGYVTHTNINIGGVWGAASGTNTTRYRLKIGGTTVGTWDIAGLEVSTKGPFNVLGATSLMSRIPSIDLTAQTLSGSGNCACQIIHCHMRQS